MPRAPRNPYYVLHWFPYFFSTPFHQTPPQVLDIPNHMANQANEIYYQAVYRSSYLMVQARYPSKS